MSKKVLTCHTEFKEFNTKSDITEGKNYEVEEENERVYKIRTDDGGTQVFTIEPDESGKSYKTWMTLKK